MVVVASSACALELVGVASGKIVSRVPCPPFSQTLPTPLACYGYIKQSTMIDKLSLRLWEGGSCVNIIMVLSVTPTPLSTPPWSKSGIND